MNDWIRDPAAHVAAFLVSIAAAVPTMGFFVGFSRCVGCTGVFDRFFVGGLNTLLACATLGDFWIDESKTIHARTAMLPVGVTIYLVLVATGYFVSKRSRSK